MNSKIIDLKKTRQEKRDKTGWSPEEIKKRALEERTLFKKIAGKEPDDLVSGGDMTNILKDENDDEDN